MSARALRDAPAAVSPLQKVLFWVESYNGTTHGIFASFTAETKIAFFAGRQLQTETEDRKSCAVLIFFKLLALQQFFCGFLKTREQEGIFSPIQVLKIEDADQ